MMYRLYNTSGYLLIELVITTVIISSTLVGGMLFYELGAKIENQSDLELKALYLGQAKIENLIGTFNSQDTFLPTGSNTEIIGRYEINTKIFETDSNVQMIQVTVKYIIYNKTKEVNLTTEVFKY
ncbi:hypothetical protein RDV78_06095 [Bacillota bacterium LX-D]|nr:hypothetical protein [Bacillota bacterium LX-D]